MTDSILDGYFDHLKSKLDGCKPSKIEATFAKNHLKSKFDVAKASRFDCRLSNNHRISNLAKIESCASTRLYHTNSYDVFFPTLRLHASETSCARRFITRFDIGPSMIESRWPCHHLNRIEMIAKAI